MFLITAEPRADHVHLSGPGGEIDVYYPPDEQLLGGEPGYIRLFGVAHANQDGSDPVPDGSAYVEAAIRLRQAERYVRGDVDEADRAFFNKQLTDVSRLRPNADVKTTYVRACMKNGCDRYAHGTANYVIASIKSLPGVTNVEVHDCKDTPYINGGQCAVVVDGARDAAHVAAVLRDSIADGIVTLGTEPAGWIGSVPGGGVHRWFTSDTWKAWLYQIRCFNDPASVAKRIADHLERHSSVVADRARYASQYNQNPPPMLGAATVEHRCARCGAILPVVDGSVHVCAKCSTAYENTAVQRTAAIRLPRPGYVVGEEVESRRGPWDGWHPAVVTAVTNEADSIGDFWVVDVRQLATTHSQRLVGPQLIACLRKPHPPLGYDGYGRKHTPLYDGLTAEQCMDRYERWQREDVSLLTKKQDGSWDVALTAMQIAAAQRLWSERGRARAEASAAAKRAATVSVVSSDDDLELANCRDAEES